MKKNQKTQESGYILPSAPELERVILGSILSEASAFERVSNVLSDEDFYYTSHAMIFKSARSLHNQRKPIDVLTIMSDLKASGNLDEVGGTVFLTDMMDCVSSSAHIEHHADIVKHKSVERQVINISHQASKKIYEGEDVEDVIFWQNKEIEKQQERLVGEHTGNHISIPVKKSIENMYTRMELNKQGKHAGITTGLTDLDKITGGWQKSELIVVAGRPGSGKTAFALKFAKAAAEANYPVAMFSLEMSDVSLADRLLLSESNVDAYKYRQGKISDEDAVEMEKAAGRLWGLPIYVDDNAAVSMSYIRSKARLLYKQGKCNLLIVDYLQLAIESNSKNQNKEAQVSQMSREAKLIAKDLNIPVILLSQLNRKNEERTDKRPVLSDLRDSGSIEQDADMVCLIHRPEYYGLELKANDTTVVKNGIEFIIAKYRNGACGGLIAQHDGTLNKIYDYGVGNSGLPF
jgi:replicative DNA helicase